MRKYFTLLFLAVSVALAFQTHAQQANPSSGEPQAWHTDMGAAQFLEDVANTLRQIHEAGRQTCLPSDFHYNIKQWTQQDITNFAKSDKTFDFFETLLGIGNSAVTTDAAGKYTKDALEAQEALTYLKPDCCKSWKGFCNMIANAADETETLRTQYHKDIQNKKKGAK